MKGAPRKAFGEKIITELIDSDCQLMVRRLAILGGHLAAEHVDGDGVADLEAEARGDLVAEGDQRLALVVRRPPRPRR